MAASEEWKGVAARQAARADAARRKVEAQEHALNLLLNGQMVEFHTARSDASTFHDFSFGIARNVPIDDPKSPRERSHRSKFEERIKRP